MANQDHLQYLRLRSNQWGEPLEVDVGSWNQWREAHPETEPDLTDARLTHCDLREANLSEADLSGADLRWADLSGADLSGADLTQAKLAAARLVEAQVRGAVLTGAWVYGVSAWNLLGEPLDQNDLLITPWPEAEVRVDDIRVAQFVLLLMTNPNIRHVIDVVGKKAVLILGRFGKRKPVLDKLRAGFRELGYAPIVFDFQKPASQTLTETVRLLAGLSAFVVADITDPNSVPHEAMAVIPSVMVPFVPLIQGHQQPWPTLESLWQEHQDRVLQPLRYTDIDELLPKLFLSVVNPALECRTGLLRVKAKSMGERTFDDYWEDQRPK